MGAGPCLAPVETPSKSPHLLYYESLLSVASVRHAQDPTDANKAAVDAFRDVVAGQVRFDDAMSKMDLDEAERQESILLAALKAAKSLASG